MLQLVASGFHLAGQHFVLGQGLAAGAGLGQALLGQAYFAAIGRAVELQDQQHLFFLLAAVAPYALFVERVRDAETEGAHLLGRQRGREVIGRLAVRRAKLQAQFDATVLCSRSRRTSCAGVRAD